MRPTIYERKIKPAAKGIPRLRVVDFYRTPTIRDYYNVLCQIQDQQHYPDIKVKFLNIVTDELTISNVANLRGMSETKEYGKLPVRNTHKSKIYFESKDKKCVGIIEDSWLIDSPLNFTLGILEAICACGLIAADLYLTPLGVIAAADAARRFYNSRKTGAISIEVGPPQDVSQPAEYSMQGIRENAEKVRRLNRKFKGIAKGSKKDLEELAEMMDEIEREEEEEKENTFFQTYSEDDLETFRKFAEHIRQIRL